MFHLDRCRVLVNRHSGIGPVEDMGTYDLGRSRTTLRMASFRLQFLASSHRTVMQQARYPLPTVIEVSELDQYMSSRHLLGFLCCSISLR